MKYKVGDKVRVRRDLNYNKRYAMEDSNYSIHPAYVMAKWFSGAEMTINDASDLGYMTVETGNTFLWTDEMLEEALPDVNINIYRSGRAIIAEDCLTGRERKAICAPEDEFDPVFGVLLAMTRLLGIPFINAEEAMKGEALDGD